MTTANIVFLIDIQEGFANNTLTHAQGGKLYVPEGEKAGPPAGALIASAKNTIFVLSADYHPENMISDMTNHPGVMAYRQKLAASLGIEDAVLPFTNVRLRQNAKGEYRVVGVVEGERVLAVETDANGFVTKVLDRDAAVLPSDMGQTLWTKHCVQKTQSALFVPEIMAALPCPLAEKLARHDPGAVLSHIDEASGNVFFIVRKGMKQDVDSNAIAIENDQKSTTAAPKVFDHIVKTLSAQNVTRVNLALGGLAGNICAELSHNNVCDLLVPALKAKGMTVVSSFMTDISHMIPISIPDGSFPDAANALTRMASYGTKPTTTVEVSRSLVKGVKREPSLPIPAL